MIVSIMIVAAAIAIALVLLLINQRTAYVAKNICSRERKRAGEE